MDSEGSQKLADVRRPEPLIGPQYTLGSVTEKISDIVLERRTTLGWIFGFLLAFSLLMLLNLVISLLMVKGVGIWGINIPVGWAFAITNFVWWIGIGHAGTLISAFLLLMHQKWRTSINRFAEAMTIFAVMCAGMFPLLHMGRPWLFYYLMPYPNPMWLWPQFRSPLVWDVFAVSTYFTVSLLFWFVGLIPDLATLRDRAKNKITRVVYGLFAMGWRGSAIHWSRYEFASLLLAGLATPLVVSVHTVVSFDFAIAMVPGWHSTIFPPYFVAGAIYSGFAMVLSLAIPLRKYFHLEDLITMKHLDIMGKVMLATGMIVAYSYIVEAFMCFYSGNQYDRFMMLNRMTGPYKYVYWSLIILQPDHSTGIMVQEGAAQHYLSLPGFDCREHWNVARAVRHHCDQPDARLCPFQVGHVLPHAMGLGDSRRSFWSVRHFVLSLRSFPAHDFDRRSAVAGA